MATDPLPTLERILADFDLFDDWEDRYRLLIDLGRMLPQLAPEAYGEANRVQGCASQVCLIPAHQGSTCRWQGDSDALIVKGLVALVLALFNGKTPSEIAAIDEKALFSRLGLHAHLSMQRANGLAAMIARIRREAAAHG